MGQNLSGRGHLSASSESERHYCFISREKKSFETKTNTLTFTIGMDTHYRAGGCLTLRLGLDRGPSQSAR